LTILFLSLTRREKNS